MSEISKVEPIVDNISGIKIYHYAYASSFYASIVSTNVRLIKINIIDISK
jgi:hypothetical protein